MYIIHMYWSNYSDLTRHGPPNVAEEGKSPFFSKIYLGEILGFSQIYATGPGGVFHGFG